MIARRPPIVLVSGAVAAGDIARDGEAQPRVAGALIASVVEAVEGLNTFSRSTEGMPGASSSTSMRNH